MTAEQWAALSAALKRTAADIKANKPLPPPSAASGSLTDIAKTIEADLPFVAQFLTDNQGIATGIADLLAALAADGVPHAGDLRRAILQTPNLLSEAEKWLPIIVGALSAFAPAATGITGDRVNPWPGR